MNTKLNEIENAVSNKNKTRKMRLCASKEVCIFKNVWVNPDRCYAQFAVWHTCLKRGTERRT
jgi:hypothetical protein